MAVTLTLAANARSSVPTEHPGKISSGPTILFGVPGITGHTICRTLGLLSRRSDEEPTFGMSKKLSGGSIK